MFCRFQEHYESPEFSGKVFTLGEFRKWYTKGKKKFTYNTDWGGFNLPGKSMLPFFDGDFDPLSKEEQWLVRSVKAKLGKKSVSSVYVIGVTSLKSITFKHELAHAMYDRHPDYKAVVNRIISRSSVSRIVKHLVKLGYAKRVIPDELNSYLMFDRGYLKSKRLWSSHLDTIREDLLVEYRKRTPI
jgi:hypothetical protein